jgi:hypothetical protein
LRPSALCCKRSIAAIRCYKLSNQLRRRLTRRGAALSTWPGSGTNMRRNGGPRGETCRIPLCVMSPSVEPVGTWVRSKNMASRRCEIESHRMHGCGTVSQQRQCFLVGFRWPLLKENLIIGGFQYTCSDTGRTGNQESKICRLPPLERLRRSALSEYPELHYPGATR